MTRARLSAFSILFVLGCGNSTETPSDETSSTGDASTSATDPSDTLPATSATDGGSTSSSSSSSSGTTEVADSSSSSGSASSSSDSSSTGTDTAPEIAVEIEAMEVGDGDSFAFADPVDVGATGSAATVTISNLGTAALELDAVTLTSANATHFVLDDSGLDASVAPGESTTVTIAYAPTNGGRKSTDFEIQSNDTDEGSLVITLEARSTPNVFRQLAPETSPAARFGNTLAALDDGRVLLFGGRIGGTIAADTWIFDPETESWTEVTPAASPPARFAHGMAHVGGGMVVLFGGTTTTGPMDTPQNDTWVFDAATETWTELSPAASPPIRFQHGMTQAGDGLALVYGGRQGFSQELDDTWIFDLDAESWTQATPDTTPGTRSAFAMAFDGVDTITLVGGTVNGSNLTDETWAYDVTAAQWTAGTAAGGGDQFNQAAAYAGGLVIVVGGKSNPLTDPTLGSWGYDGAMTWTQLLPTNEPPPRFSNALAGVGGDKIIMFGGLTANASPASADAATWEYVAP